MVAIRMLCLVALLAGAMPVSASSVFRCKTDSGKIYYSDKGCGAGHAYTQPTGKGSVSTFQGKAMSGGAGTYKPPAASAGSSPSIGPRYIQRANSGAARADETLKKK